MSQNNEKQNYYSLLTGPRRAVPIILCALGAFLAFCYFTASTGLIGGAVINVLKGLFSYGAYAAAPLLILHGIFYPSDVAKKRTVSRIIFSSVAVLCIAVISYAVFYISADVKPSFTASDYYQMGIEGEGGGFIGSVVAYGIIKVLGSVGLVIITAAVFAIYVAYFFTDGHGVIGKVCLAIVSFFANIGAFFERKIKSGFGKIKDAKTEKDKRISVAKSRDLSEDDFFMVDNGMQNFEIPDLGIKETRSEEPEGTPMLHDKVRLKSSVDEAPEEKATLSNVRIIEEEERKKEAPKPKPARKKILHTDFGLDDAVIQDEPKRQDDIIYDEPTPSSYLSEDSAENVFTKNFDPFDISVNEKLASKPSSKRSAGTVQKKETARFTEDISNITPEDIERARRQAEFDMKKRTLLESFAPKEEEAAPTIEEPVQEPETVSTPVPVLNFEPKEELPTAPAPSYTSTYIGGGGTYSSPSESHGDFVFDDPEEAAAPIYEKAPEEPVLTPTFGESFESYAAEDTAAKSEPASDYAPPRASTSGTNYERLARFSGVITEYSTAEKTRAEEKPTVIEEYKVPLPEEPSASPSYEENSSPRAEFISLPEEPETITLEHEKVSPLPDDLFAEKTDVFTEESAERSVLDNEENDSYTPDEKALSEGAEEDFATHTPEIIPEDERNPKIEEYRSMFPVLDEETEEADELPDDGGLTFEHAEIPEPDPEPEEEEVPEDTADEDEPPFDVDDIIDEPDDVPAPVPEKKPEPPKPKKPDYSKYKFPPIDLLGIDEDAEGEDVNAEIEENANNLISTLNDFRVKASIKGVDRGPRITRYEIVPATGVKVSSIMNLQDDIQLRLAAEGIRMEAPIPGKSAIGFELPNRKPSTVRLRSLLETEEFTSAKSKTIVCIGKDVAGCPVFGDIAKMPHMLIAGATGMGKSVCINSLMISMLYKAKPDEVKFIMIDPKKVEFTMYNGIPHLLIPVVADPKQAAGALMWAVEQMEKRYELIEKARVRNIEMYNEKVAKDPSLGEPMPKIVIVIDEFADLMLQVRDPVEGLVMSIAQKARAAGIHLVIGTQRPSVDVITGVIKANIPSRISCKVMSNTDSRTVLDQKGAEDLLDKGDMLFFPSGKPKPVRVQGAFVSDGEVEEIMEFIKSQGGDENYDSTVMEEIARNAQKCNKKGSDDRDDDDGDGEDSQGFLNDQKFLDAVNVAVTTGKISTSLLQRKLSIGYGKAAKYVDIMEDMGIVSESNGQKARDVLMTRDEWHEKLARLSLDD